MYACTMQVYRRDALPPVCAVYSMLKTEGLNLGLIFDDDALCLLSLCRSQRLSITITLSKLLSGTNFCYSSFL